MSQISNDPGLSKALANSEDIAKQCSTILYDTNIPADEKSRFVAACLAIAMEHHCAVVTLIKNDLVASAAALLRVITDAFVRGVWLYLCATDVQFSEYKEGKIPKFPNLFSALEMKPEFKSGVLSRTIAPQIPAMHDYTHTGLRQVSRWQTEDSVEPRYTSDEIREIVSYSESIGLLAASWTCILSNDNERANKIHELVGPRLMER